MLAALTTRPLGTPRALHPHLPIAGDPASRPGRTCVTGTPRYLVEPRADEAPPSARTSAERRWLDQEEAPPAASYRSPRRYPSAQRELLPWRHILAVAGLTACAAMAGAWFERTTHDESFAEDLPPPIELFEVAPERAPVAQPVPASGEPAPATGAPAIAPRRRITPRRRRSKTAPKAKPTKPGPFVIPSTLPPMVP